MFQKKVIMVILISVLTLVFLTPSLTLAHGLWVSATDYNPSFKDVGGGKTKIFLGWGHRYPVDDFVNKESFEKIVLIAPDLTKKNIELETTGFAAAELAFNKPGLYTVAVTRKETFFTVYMKNGKEERVRQSKEGLPDVVRSTHSQQYAKTIIQVGTGNDNNISAPVGHNLEIIPLANPYTLNNNTGGRLAVKVLLNGKPAVYTNVFASYAGFVTGNEDESAFATTTNQEGIAHIRITRWGQWILKTSATAAATGDMAKKANQVNYSASLTFLVP